MQRRNIIFLVFCSISIIPHITYSKMVDEQLRNDDDHKPKKCGEVHHIFAKDINHDGKGFTIDEPGYWKLCEDVAFEPHGSKTRAAITIKASDVMLNLDDHTLSMDVSKKKHKAIGIKADGVSSISIKDGSITDFNIAGIKIDDSTDIMLDDLNILRTGKPSSVGGLQINNSSDILIKELRSLTNFGCGMYLHGVIKATVLNSHFDDNVGGNASEALYGGPGMAAAGTYVDSSDTTVTAMVYFHNCSFNRNSGGGEGVGLGVGPVTFSPIRDVNIVSCEFLDNFMTGGDSPFNDSSGLALVRVENFLIQDCVASGQRHPSPKGPLADPAVAGATGISINISSNGILENCQANDNAGLGSSSIGIRIRACENIIVKNSECSGNTNDGSGQAFGFYTDTDSAFFLPPMGTTYIFDSCVAQNNTSDSGLAGGFKIATLQNSVVKNCISQDNGYGILVTDPVYQQTLHNIFEDNIVQGNTLVGIEDNVTSSDNAYTKNIARNNSGGNYVGLPSGTPFVVWSISGAPLVATNSFANLDIIP